MVETYSQKSGLIVLNQICAGIKFAYGPSKQITWIGPESMWEGTTWIAGGMNHWQ